MSSYEKLALYLLSLHAALYIATWGKSGSLLWPYNVWKMHRTCPNNHK